MIESLELRRLCRTPVLHDLPVFSVVNGTLSVSGSQFDDIIGVHRVANRLRLTLNGRTVTVRGRVSSAIIYGGRGNDRINFGGDDGEYGEPDLYDINMSAYIDGGAGNDTLQGGEGQRNTLLGGAGNDRLYGVFNRSTLDYQDGGPGDDRLYYAGTMYGGQGHDVATADNFGYSLVSGLEGLYQENEQNGQVVIPRADWLSDLYVNDNRLVFKYRTFAGYETTTTDPFVNEHGVLEVDVTSKSVNARPQPPAGTIIKLFNPAEAARRGIVLSVNGESQETVLIAAR